MRNSEATIIPRNEEPLIRKELWGGEDGARSADWKQQEVEPRQKNADGERREREITRLTSNMLTRSLFLYETPNV